MLCMHLWDICEALHCLPDGAALRPGGNKPILCLYPNSESARTSWLLSLYTRSYPEDVHECGQGTLVISYSFPQLYKVCSVQGAYTDVQQIPLAVNILHIFRGGFWVCLFCCCCFLGFFSVNHPVSERGDCMWSSPSNGLAASSSSWTSQGRVSGLVINLQYLFTLQVWLFFHHLPSGNRKTSLSVFSPEASICILVS